MKTKLLTIVLLCLSGVGWGQEMNDLEKKALLTNAEKDFTQLKDEYLPKKAVYDVEKKKFEELVKEVDLNASSQLLNQVQTQQQTTKTLNNELAEIIKKYESYKVYYTTKGLTAVEITKIFEPDSSIVAIDEEPVKTKIISYFGENETIDFEILKDKSGKEVDVFKKVLATKGEKNYFGDITIPKAGEEFYFYDWDKNIVNDKKFKFKKIDVEIRDGYFYDIVAYVEDNLGNTHVFTNSVGLSILYYSHYGKRKLLYYTHSQKKNATANGKYTDDELSELYIKLTDIFSYNYNIGKHYIPNEMALKLPNDIKDNTGNNVTYEIRQETSLEKILELRAYTDFLALFGEEENGLVQIEGKANFYIFPNPVRMLGTKRYLGQIEFLPTISPFVNYSRFEKGNRYVSAGTNTFAVDSGTGALNFERGLGLIEKRFLTMGLVFQLCQKSQIIVGQIGVAICNRLA